MFRVASIDGFVYIFSGGHLIHPPTSTRGLAFEDALKASGFFSLLLKTVELIGALCLLSNRTPALGLSLPSPIMAVVVLFHLVLNPGGLTLALLLAVCGTLLLRTHAPRFVGLFTSGTAAGR